MPDGWDGVVLPGGFRGYPLTICALHGGWWTVAKPCPACGLAARIAELERTVGELRHEQHARCAECAKRTA